jgi:hypothetical protein
VTEYDFSETRHSIYDQLEEIGFRCARWLPAKKTRTLRPTLEIAQRVAAIKAVAGWVCFPESDVPFGPIDRYMEEYRLRDFLSEKEASMMRCSREQANELHHDSIGWSFEGAWSLAWVLGYGSEPPGLFGDMIADEVVVDVIRDFAPDHRSAPDLVSWANARSVRDEQTIAEIEDVLYCIHNAARGAAHGNPDSVPAGFNPAVNGGVIQERRQGLTWALQPGIAWDDTDVST